ncbi:MAG: cadherin-like domain-containing protein [Proteobacteria bacterium]|nr:cadherin-like domain-containing protein [Pseudomonadota bacterium]
MATDTTTNHTDTVNTASTIHEGDVEQAHLTQAGAPVQVQVPQGENVVRVQVTPGETVELPFPTDGLVARLGDNGNLAVKVGDVTVILVGYADATGQGDITILGNDGKSVDVAAVLAATDPNLDIQTAAGPGAGDQGTGADNNGGNFSPFDPNAGIGGLNAIGGLDPTALNYNLIQRQFVDIIEADEVDTSPVLIGVKQGPVVNEDDLGRTPVTEDQESAQSESLSAHGLSGNWETPANGYEIMQRLSGGEGNDGPLLPNAWCATFGTHKDGNDPFDTQDHEEGSQTGGAYTDDNNGDTDGGIDQDREPLSSTAVIEAQFFADLPGKVTFDTDGDGIDTGDTPIIQQLLDKGLTSHGHELAYLLLPEVPESFPGAGDGHGQMVVAYYLDDACNCGYEESFSQTEGHVQVPVIVFTLSIDDDAATATELNPAGNSEIPLTFTIYGVIDNVPGVADNANDVDPSGNITDILDIEVPFFLRDSDGSVTPVPGTELVFHDVDDNPELGCVRYGCWNNIPYEIVDANLTIGHDESKGVQHTDYDSNLPDGSVQDTDDVGNKSAHHIEHKIENMLEDITTGTASGEDVDISYQQGILGKLSPEFLSDGCFHADALGVAKTYIHVSFGADGKAGGDDYWGEKGGNDQAGLTKFQHDNDAGVGTDNSNFNYDANGNLLGTDDGGTDKQAFELFMKSGQVLGEGESVITEASLADSAATNWTIDFEQPDGTVVQLTVYAYQLDANTIIGMATPPVLGDGGGNDYSEALVAETPTGSDIPVFVLRLDPDSGELVFVQYHQIHNTEGGDVNGENNTANDGIHLYNQDGSQLVYFEATDFDGDTVQAQLEVTVVDDAPKTWDVCYYADEDALPNGVGDIVSPGDGNGGVVINGAFGVKFGVDKPGSIDFASLEGDNATARNSAGGVIALTSLGAQVVYHWDEATHTLTGVADGRDVFSVVVETVNGHATGNFTFTLLDQLDHPFDNGANEAGDTGSGFEDNLILDLVYKATDSDGDSASGSLIIKVDDDMPVFSGCTCDNLLINGSFELPDVTNGSYGIFGSIPGWYSTSGDGIEVQDHAAGNPQDGQQLVELDSNNNSNMVQDVTTEDGNLYDLSVWYTPRMGDTATDGIEVWFDGQLIATLDGSGQTPGQWVKFTYQVQAGENDATPDLSKLEFRAVGSSDSLGGYIDNVSLCKVNTLNEDDLANGSDNSKESLTVSGATGVNFGADEGAGFTNLSLGVALKSMGFDVVLGQPDANGVAMATSTDGRDIFKVEFTKTGGEYDGNFKLTLIDQLDHPAGNGENTTEIVVNFTASDKDGDSVNGHLSVTVIDDLPCAWISECHTDNVTIDETKWLQNDDQWNSQAPQGFKDLGSIIAWGESGNPVVTFGGDANADEPASIVLTIKTTDGADSGITDLNGTAILLYNENGLVVGHVGNQAGPVAFALSIDQDGELSVAQYIPLKHPDTNSNDEGISINDGALQAVVTVTDFDQDVASKSVDIGGKVTFEDDGPKVECVEYTSYFKFFGHDVGYGSPVAIVDEDWINKGNQDADGSWPTNGDLVGLSYATGKVNVDFGADGNGGFSIKLLAQDMSAGVLRSSDNAEVFLHQNSAGEVVGYVGGDPTDPANIVFKLTLDTNTGDFRFDLYQALEHGHPGGENNDNAQDIDLGFTIGAKDGDGDEVTAGIVVRVDDDSPDGFEVKFVNKPGDDNEVKESGIASDSGDDTTFYLDFGFAGGVGADQPGTTTLSLDTALTNLNGEAIVLVDNGAGGYNGVNVNNPGDIYFTITKNGNGSFTFDMVQSIKHDNPGSDSKTVNFTATVTDSDGDKSSDSFAIKIKDDVPSEIEVRGNNAKVDEDFLTTATNFANGQQDGDTNPDNGENAASNGDGPNGTSAGGSLAVNFGADGGSLSLTSVAVKNSKGDSVPLAALTTADGGAINIAITNGAITGTRADNPGVKVFELTLVGNNWAFTLYQALEHPFNDANNQNNGPETRYEDNLNFEFGVKATDGDGDTKTATIKVTVDDDAPTACCVEGDIDEPSQTAVVDAGHVTVNPGNYPAISNMVEIRVAAPGDAGASLNENENQAGVPGFGVTSAVDGGDGGRYNEINYMGNGEAGDTTSEVMIFELQNNAGEAAEGKWATSADVEINVFFSTEGAVGNEVGSYSLYKDGVLVAGPTNFVATSTSGNFNLHIDGPAGGFDEIRFAALPGTTDGNGNDSGDSSDYNVKQVTLNLVEEVLLPTEIAGSICANFGADGAGDIAFITTGDSGYDHNGVSIVNTLSPDGNTVIGKAGDEVIWKITLNDETKEYDFELYGTIDGNADAVLHFDTKVTDADGDYVNGCVTITVDSNDVPTLTVTYDQTAQGGYGLVDEDFLAAGNKDLPTPSNGDDLGGDSASCTGHYDANFFGDTPGTVALNATEGADTGLDTTGGANVLWHNIDAHTAVGYVQGSDASNPANWVFQVGLGATDANGDGTWTFTLLQSLKHGSAGTEDNLSLNVPLQATDSNGDHADAAIAIQIDDDMPVMAANVGSAGFYVDETNLAANAGPADVSVIFPTATLGADGGSVTYSLTGAGGAAFVDGTNSGLVDTLTNAAVLLYKVGNNIEGKTAGGDVVFTLVLSGSNMTLDQARAVVHADPNDANDSVSVSGLVYVTKTATDGDGDSVSVTTPNGVFMSFSDDAPNAVDDSDAVVTFGVAITGNVTDNDSSGADVDAGFPKGKVESFTIDGNTYAADGTVHNIPGHGTMSMTPTGEYEFIQTDGAAGSFGVTYKLVDGDGDSDPAVLTITTVDAPVDLAPINYNDANAGDENGAQQNNVMIILDRSGSMDDVVGGNGETRLDLAKAAIQNLLNKYDQLGDVKVLIVQFASDGQRMEFWGTPAEAMNYINSDDPAGQYTSYEDAVSFGGAGLADNDGKIPGAPTTVYFLSDGTPTIDGDSGNNNSLTNAQKTVWDNALENNGVTKVYAVGVGPGLDALDQDLIDVANPDGNNNPASEVIIVTNENGLAAELEGTIGSGDITGNVLTGVDTSGMGDNGVPGAPGTADANGDGANHIYTLSHDGNGSAFDVAFSWDGVSANALSVGGVGTNVSVIGHVVSFDTEFGRMVFNMETGAYTFTPGAVAQTQNVVFHYGTMDADGDVDVGGGVDGDNAAGGADLVITINNVNHAPVAADNTASGNEDTVIIIPIATLLGNDSDPDGDAISMFSVQNGVNGTAVINGANVEFTPGANFSGAASFTYTITDPSGLTSTATCNVTVNGVNDAPVNAVGNVSGDEDTQIAITTLSVSDVDAGTDDITVTVSVPNGSGTLAVNNNNGDGVTVNGSNNGDGNTAQLILVGSQANINAMLQTLMYTPPANFNGQVTLTMTTNDGGNNGSGGAKTDVDQITISVADVAEPNQAPSIGQDRIITNEAGGITIQDSWLLRNDTDAENNTLTITGAAAGAGQGTFFDTAPAHAGTAITFDLDIGSGSNKLGDGETTSMTYTLSDGALTDNTPAATITYESSNTLTGGANDEIIIGNSGNDTINGGGGIDVLIGGGGNDTLVFDAADHFRDGGSGFDRLQATTSFTFDNTGSDAKMVNIEMVDLGDSNHNGDRTVTLNVADVLGTTNVTVNVNGTNHNIDLFVIGDNSSGAVDNVDLNGFTQVDVNGGTPGNGTFNYTDAVTGASHTYTLWQSGDQSVKVAVESGLDVI